MKTHRALISERAGSDLAVLAQASIMFWFTSTDKAFTFSTGEHTAVLTIMSGSREMSEKRLRIVIRDDVVESLNDPLSSPTGEYRAEVVSQE